MKALGIKQFHQKKFKFLPIKNPQWKKTLGDLPFSFVLVIGGFSGGGKTEACMQLADELCEHGKVGWFSYEQRHGADLQRATIRNKMERHSGNFIPIDPLANLPNGVSLLEDLDKYLSKRGSPDFIFIDSVDYTGWKTEDYKYLWKKYYGKKAFIFICHTDKSGNPRKTIATDIVFDGGVFFFVKKYILFPEKNRFGGFEPLVIYEEQARKWHPLFFDPKTKVETKKANNQTELFDNSKNETKGVKKNEGSETKGVNAKIDLKKVG